MPGLRSLFGVFLAATVCWAEDGLPLSSLPERPQPGLSLPANLGELLRPDLSDPLSGHWRVRGRDSRFGAFRGSLFLDPLPGGNGYRYERRLDAPRDGRRAAGPTHERGRAVLAGRQLYLREEPRASFGLLQGLGAGLSPGPVAPRHAFFRLGEAYQQGRGMYVVPAGLRRGREQLIRPGPEAPNNDVRLLVDGGEFFGALREEFANARRSICLQTFIYTDDATGQWVGRLLAERARAGVSVRVLVDALSTRIGPTLRAEWEEAGVELIVQHGWAAGIRGSLNNLVHGIGNGIRGLFGRRSAPREQRGVFNHDHRKIIVVDGRVGFIGGMNIAREYEHDWHDVHARVEGNVVAELAALFDDRWEAAGGRVPPALPADAEAARASDPWPGSMQAEVAVTLPGVSTEIKTRYLDAIRSARRSIHVEVAYFLDDSIIGGLKQQARRGLDTVVIVPNDRDHDVGVVRDAFNWVQNDVVRAGIKLYKYRGRMVHSKVACFDGRLATVGSANLDRLALVELAEANLFVNDRGFAQTMERRVFQADIPRSERVRVSRLSWWQRLKGGVLFFFRSFL